jgi:hypothetical protein
MEFGEEKEKRRSSSRPLPFPLLLDRKKQDLEKIPLPAEGNTHSNSYHKNGKIKITKNLN